MQNNTTSEQTLDNNEDGEVVGCGSEYSEGHELDDDNKNVYDIIKENQFEDRQEFNLINQIEVQEYIGQRATLKLKYAILCGTKLTLYDEVPPEES